MQRILLILTLILAPALLAGQDSTSQKFVKIIHSADRTVAVDSTGQTWRYDAELSEFVPARESDWEQANRSVGTSRRDYEDEEVILPPEIRCTEVHEGDISELINEVVIELDERIEGTVFSRRNVTVKGLVTGDVISLQTVTVESTGEVRGDVMASEIRRERGGRIHGQREEIPSLDIPIPRITRTSSGAAWLIVTAVFLFISVIVIALVPRQLGVVIDYVEQGLVKSFFWGILGWFLLLPVMVILLITIVGIPLAILLPLAFIVAQLLAFVAIAVYLGKRIAALLGWPSDSVHLQGIYGVVALNLFLLIADALALMGAETLSILSNVCYGITLGVAVTVGFGAVLTTRFGTRKKLAGPAPGTGPVAPAPEVVPPTPPVSPPPPPQSDSSPRTTPPPPPMPPPPRT